MDTIGLDVPRNARSTKDDGIVRSIHLDAVLALLQSGRDATEVKPRREGDARWHGPFDHSDKFGPSGLLVGSSAGRIEVIRHPKAGPLCHEYERVAIKGTARRARRLLRRDFERTRNRPTNQFGKDR